MDVGRPVLALVMAGFCVPAQAKPLPRYGILVYSNLCWEKESGDAAGARIMLIRDGDGNRLFFEWSDGPLEGPVQATKLSIDDKSDLLDFSVDIGSQESVDSSGIVVSREKPHVLALQGAITDNSLTLQNMNMRKPEVLPRVRNFAAKSGECR